jgi:2-polyprenyl-3-methyl-5-hydroxy-6-metoxy-1,4-benzoquinol methylase
MDWKKFWNEKGGEENPFAQVARIGGQTQHDEDLLELIVEHIVAMLDLKSDEVLLDVCCGNGLLTSKLAKHCKKVIGIDLSEVLINHAKHMYPEIEFICADALELNSSTICKQYSSIDKINLCFSFQYFDSYELGKRVIENLLPFLKQDGKIFLGDIPDSIRFFEYYNTPMRIIQLIKQTLQHKNSMGKFWSENELAEICKQLNVFGKKLIQPEHLSYANYRMDWVINKSNL